MPVATDAIAPHVCVSAETGSFKTPIAKATSANRANDRYREVVTDPTTKEIIHHCEEPLSQHQNHGSAKKRR
jgi:hypothetical protein